MTCIYLTLTSLRKKRGGGGQMEVIGEPGQKGIFHFYFCNFCNSWSFPNGSGSRVQESSTLQPRAWPWNALDLWLSLSLLSSVETVNDGQFHSVELVMLNQTLNLVVDKGAPKSLGKLQKQPAVGINSPLYLGGNTTTPPSLHRPFHLSGFLLLH